MSSLTRARPHSTVPAWALVRTNTYAQTSHNSALSFDGKTVINLHGESVIGTSRRYVQRAANGINK